MLIDKIGDGNSHNKPPDESISVSLIHNKGSRHFSGGLRLRVVSNHGASFSVEEVLCAICLISRRERTPGLEKELSVV